ncbi:hemoblobin-interacting domain-containing protein [Clostridium hydrogeniformans]|uniref:hemoblobin-interacting domain-containing protein n=1 Tax=Clostridium hydrogeniformans TaxID=349933 RepID=UPI000486DC8D|nr:hemoblobin-interacting domain-containing protein [Clostridium hydrogeniformans]
MIKRSSYIKALAMGITFTVFYGISAKAAPTEIYGYRRMSLYDFHKSSYDKYGNVRYMPGGSEFSTTGNNKVGGEVDTTTTASIKNNSVAKSSPIVRAKRSAKTVDVLSSASKKDKPGKDGGSDVVTSASGGFVASDVVFDFNMLSNAFILKDLGYDVKEANEIIDIFNTTTRTHIGKRGVLDFLVDYEDYLEKANNAFYDDEYLSFEDYIKSNDYKKRNYPYKVKYILEDGAFGDQMDPMEVNKKDSPKVNPDLENNIKGNKVELKFKENEDWANNLESIRVGNNLPEKLIGDYVKAEKDKLIIDSSVLDLGNNALTIKTKGYRTIYVNQPIYKGKVKPEIKNSNLLGEDIKITKVTEDYIKSLKSISINGKTLDKNNYYYEKEGNTLIIKKETFDGTGVYSITLNNEPEYENITLTTVINRDNKEGIRLIPDITNNVHGEILELLIENYNEELNGKIEKIYVGQHLYDFKKENIRDGKLIITPEDLKNQKGKIQIKLILKDGNEISAIQVVEENKDILNAPKLKAEPREVGQDIYLDFEKNHKWERSIYSIKLMYAVESTGLATELEYKVQDGRIILKYDSNVFRRNGMFKVRVFANGYEPEDVMVELKKDHPSFLLPYPPKVNEEFKIQMTQGTQDSDWSLNINSVTLDGKPLEKDKDFSPMVTGIKFLKDSITTKGDHKLVVKSTGYKDYEVVLKIRDNNGDLVDPIEVDKLFFKDTVVKGEDFVIETPQSSWLENIIQCELNGASLKEGDFEIKDNKFIIKSHNITKDGENELFVKAKNHNKVKIKFNVKNNTALKNGPIIEGITKDNIASKDIELSFKDDEPWRNSVGNIKINGVNHSLKEVHLEKGKIVFPSGLLKDGLNNIVIEAKGYNNVSFVQEIGKTIPDKVAILLKTIKQGDKVVLNYAYTSEFNVENITVNGQEVGLKNNCERTMFGDLYINTKGELFKEAGTYSVVIKAKGFADKEFIITVKERKIDKPKDDKIEDGNKEKETNKELKEVPSSVSLLTADINLGDKVRIDDAKTYNYKVDKVLVNNKELTLNKDYSIDLFGIMRINEEVFNKEGEYTITLKAEGFKDKELKVNVKDKNKKVEENKDKPKDKIKPGDKESDNLENNKETPKDEEKKNQLKEVPFNVDLNASNISLGEKAKVRFAKSSEYTVNKVLVNNKEIDMTKYTSFNFMAMLEISEEVLNKAGEYIITLKAEGFKDKDFKLTVKDTNINKEKETPKDEEKKNENKKEDVSKVEDNNLKEVSSNVSLFTKEVFLGEAVRIDSVKGREYTVESVLINGEEIDFKTFCTIDFFGIMRIKGEAFKDLGENTITLKAKDFKDKELKVNIIEKKKK